MRLTVTDWEVLPPAPVHVSVNVVVAVSAEEVTVPLVGSEVLENPPPLSEHEVAP